MEWLQLTGLLSSRRFSRRIFMGAGALALAISACGLQGTDTAHAAGYPDRPIMIIVPFPPGGGTDTVARAISELMGKDLGQPVIIENRGGANGAIGSDMAAKAAADGYTLYLGNLGTLAITPHLDKNIRYDPIKDFKAITQVNASSTILVVNPKIKANTLAEFIALAKSAPGKLNYASSSPATILPMELLKSMAGIDIAHIPYKGSGPAMTDLLAGHVDVMFGGALPTIPHVTSGALRALAVAGSVRSGVLPDLPTIAEGGFPGYAADSWNGLLAPAGTPDDIIGKLNAAAVKALKDPSIAKKMESEGAVVVGNSPKAFGDYIISENAKWKGVIEKMPDGIKLD